MAAYHGDPALKADVLAQLAEHRRLDQIVQGTYWEHGRGCAVGCLTHDPSGGHDQFPGRWGVPEHLAYLIDAISERLPPEQAQDWSARIMAAIPVGADLSRVWPMWAAWMLGDLTERVEGVDRAAVRELCERAAAGDVPTPDEWAAAGVEVQRSGWSWAVAKVAAASRATRSVKLESLGVTATADEWLRSAVREAAREAAWADATSDAPRTPWATSAADELVRLVESAPVVVAK